MPYIDLPQEPGAFPETSVFPGPYASTKSPPLGSWKLPSPSLASVRKLKSRTSRRSSSASSTARSIALRSSRTLPGHG